MTDSFTERSLEVGPRLTFGIYPGMTGNEPLYTGSFPDDPERTNEALDYLHPDGRPFVVRSYVISPIHRRCR